jgi:hypothetical protein
MTDSSPASSIPALTDQFPRVLRFYTRITREDKAEPDYQDDIWAFFQNCWHLKDWIKNDENVMVTRALCPICKNKDQKFVKGREVCIECEINRCNYIPICADLANRSKHSQLLRNRKDGRMLADVAVMLGGAPTESGCSVTYSYFVVSRDTEHVAALDLAKNAIEEWKTLFQRWGLA